MSTTLSSTVQPGPAQYDIDRRAFLRRYVSAIHEGHAALFVGAGISHPAGFVDWRGLLRNCARELGLDIDREQDLVAVAQYYLNRIKDRWLLNQILSDEFDRQAGTTPNHEIISRLPIRTVWTTNFDTLLERSYEAASRRVDLKVRDQDIALPRKGRDVVLYKMHGDIARPDEVTICKDDYERYARLHPVFQNALQSDLISKTFLFLGFSFTDPNIDYMLGHLRSLLEESRREHYAIMRRARLNWHIAENRAQREFEYEQTKQRLRIQDLQRYNIQTVLVDRYEEVTDILRALERGYYCKTVFISGSANQYGDFGEDRMRDLCMLLGETLMSNGYKVVSGMGLNIGDAVVKGALVRLYECGRTKIDHYLFLRPFPRNLPAQIDEAEFNESYRADLISRSGFAIFIAGTSRSRHLSAGVLQEFELCKRLRRVPIPLGATGFAARRIWELMQDDMREYYGSAVSKEEFARLADPGLSNGELVATVMSILERVGSD